MSATTPYKIFTSLLLAVFMFSASSTFAAICDFLWGGSNEATAYTAPYFPGMGGVSLTNAPSPPMNLGAPDTQIPVQATPTTQPLLVQQSNVPMLTVPSGPVGAVGQPATSSAVTPALGSLPPGAELMYILPPKDIPSEQCPPRGTPAIAAQVVPPTTPGAIPVAVRNMTVTRPKINYEWTYAPMAETTGTLVKVVDQRTGRVLRTYCETSNHRSLLPWPHRKEIVSYEKVVVQVATPLSPEAVRQLTSQTYRSERPIAPVNELTTTVLDY